MRAVIQRVRYAHLRLDEENKRSIDHGLLVLLGIEKGDTQEDTRWLCRKITNMRIFADKDGLMNLSVNEIHGQIMLVSQFTLHASTKKGNRPSWIKAAEPAKAEPLYNDFVKELEGLLSSELVTGKFGAMMQIEILNDGPVTIIIDSKNKE